MGKKEKKKYEVVYLVNESYGELPTFDTKEEGYAFIDGLTWHCKISPDKHPCESCNAEFDVFETEQSLEPISESPRPTGEEELKKKIWYLVNGCHASEEAIKENSAKSIDDEIDDIIKIVREQLSLAREEGRKYQRELDEMINGVSIQDSNLERGKKYVVISQETYDSLTNQSKESENTPS